MASEISETTSPPRFFVLESAQGSSHDTVFEVVGGSTGAAPRCPRCGEYIGMLPWLPPYRVKLDLYGQDFGDFVEGIGGTALISERLADVLRVEGLRGFVGFEPVEVVQVRRSRRGTKPAPRVLPRYFHVTSAFGSAAVDEAQSQIKRPRPISCDWCRASGANAIHGFSLEPQSWNGDDVFRARGLPGTLIASERFARSVARHGFTNMQFTLIEKYVRGQR